MKTQTWRQWARACVKDPSSPSKITKDMLAALTGTDARALDAIVACLEAYAYTGEPAVFEAVRVLVRLMQVHTRPLARELIPFVLDWSDREKLWPLVAPPASPRVADRTGYETIDRADPENLIERLYL